MKDPLTKKELREFEKIAIGQFRQEYHMALSSGAFEEEIGQKHDHTIAKIAFRKSALRGVMLLNTAGREAEKNYSHF